MWSCKKKSSLNKRLLLKRTWRASIQTKPSCDWVHFNDSTNHLAHDLCMHQWILPWKKHHRHLDLRDWTNCHNVHLLLKFQSIRNSGFHSINCQLYRKLSHRSFHMELWAQELQRLYNDSIYRYHLLSALFFCLYDG